MEYEYKLIKVDANTSVTKKVPVKVVPKAPPKKKVTAKKKASK